ncbi:NUDIX hydrolase [Agrobacterium rhizogenes]|nr:NUDIX hydrolase [Rhizobium rhizogenes]NTG54058.1 NUDIX hydrolase [Rhizobium rhizogenes]
MKIEVSQATTSIEFRNISVQTKSVEQAGAICIRKRKGQAEAEVLLIVSRRNGRWGIPKGHVDPGETSRDTARREAFEEAGVKGDVLEQTVGSFTYRKDGTSIQYLVAVHVLHVTRLSKDFPEKDIRNIKWVPISSASREVAQTGLRQILKNLFNHTEPPSTDGRARPTDLAMPWDFNEEDMDENLGQHSTFTTKFR